MTGGAAWAGLAKCYAGVIGEQPLMRPYQSSLVADPYVDLTNKEYHVSSMLIPVAAPGTIERTVGIQVDPRGMVVSAEVSEMDTVLSVMDVKK